MLKQPLVLKTRCTPAVIDVSLFRRDMLCIVSPQRHSVVSDDKLPTFARSFEATPEALLREASRSLSSRVVPPRVVKVLSTDSVDVFCVAPLCLLVPSDASQLDTICNSAVNSRHRFIRNKHRFLTRHTIVGIGDKFVFNDGDPGTAHAAMAPSCVIFRNITAQVS